MSLFSPVNTARFGSVSSCCSLCRLPVLALSLKVKIIEERGFYFSNTFSSLKFNLSAGVPALKSENMEDRAVGDIYYFPCLALNCHPDEKHMFSSF